MDQPAWLSARTPESRSFRTDTDQRVELNAEKGTLSVGNDGPRIDADNGITVQVSRSIAQEAWLSRLLGRPNHRLHVRILQTRTSHGHRPAIELTAVVPEADVTGLPWLTLEADQAYAEDVKSVVQWALSSGAELARWQVEDTVSIEERAATQSNDAAKNQAEDTPDSDPGFVADDEPAGWLSNERFRLFITLLGMWVPTSALAGLLASGTDTAANAAMMAAFSSIFGHTLVLVYLELDLVFFSKRLDQSRAKAVHFLLYIPVVVTLAALSKSSGWWWWPVAIGLVPTVTFAASFLVQSGDSSSD